jgi:hypothetical protein
MESWSSARISFGTELEQSASACSSNNLDFLADGGETGTLIRALD